MWVVMVLALEMLEFRGRGSVRGGIARVRSGGGERLDVRLSVIIGHQSRLVL